MQSENEEISSDSDAEESGEKIKRRRMLAQQLHMEQIGNLNIRSIATNIASKLALRRKRKKENKYKDLLPQRRSLRLSKPVAENQAAILDDIRKIIPPEEHKMSTLDNDNISKVVYFPASNPRVTEHDKKISNGVEPLESFIKSTQKAVSKGCIDKKMVRKQIMTMALSGNSDEKLIAVGDIHGSVGIWNFDQRKTDGGDVCWFTADSASVRCIRFSPRDNRQLYMAGYSGRFRAANLERLVLETCLINNESYPISSFDFQDKSSNVVICGTKNGKIIIKDVRSSKKKVDFYDVHDRVVKSVSFHPLKSQYFATAGSDAQIKVWDARKLSESGKVKPITVASHAKTVNSAFFSPLSGNQLLSTSLDNTIKLFNTMQMEEGRLECLKTAIHDNCSSRLSFQATWHPKREDLFFIGSMKEPRRIDLYDAQMMEMMYVYEHETFSSRCAVVCHHPTLNFIACGDSYGRVCIFDDDAV